jgi:membrane fusion protein (multidrug efflux system)
MLKWVGVLLALSCAACSNNAPAAEPKPPPPHVTVMTVRAKTIPIQQDFVGSTGAVQEVDIRARVKGTLDQVNFKEGSLVRAGQVLFVLQKDTYEAQVQSAQASLLKSKAQLYEAQQSVPVLQAQAVVEQKRALVGREQASVDRLTPLAAAHAVPQSDLDDATQGLAGAKADLDAAQANLTTQRVEQKGNIEGAQAAVLSSQADLANAKLNLSYCTITAPATGVIGYLKYDVGNVVGDADSQVLDTLSTSDPIKVLFGADENTYLALATRTQSYHGQRLRDQPVTLLLSNNKDYAYKGSLYTVGRTLDPKTGTITVEARFPNPDGVLRPGQFGRIRLITDIQENALVIPQIAVVQTQGANSAYVVQSDGTVVQRSLSLGPLSGDSYVVLSGLRDGDRVIVQGVQKAVPGQKVQVASAASN